MQVQIRAHLHNAFEYCETVSDVGQQQSPATHKRANSEESVSHQVCVQNANIQLPMHTREP